MKTIQIACTGSTVKFWTELHESQGKIKRLAKADYERLRDQIIKHGFSEPISIWMNGRKAQILNGHQRLRAIKTMVEKEDWKCPKLPVNLIEASDWKHARRKILALTSQFGRTRAEGLKNFLADTDITPQELLADFSLADLDLVDWVETTFGTVGRDDLDLGDAPKLSEEELANPDEHPTTLPPSGHTRMMQIVLETAVAEDFMQKIEVLKGHYKTSNVSDTVLNALKELFDAGNQTAKTKDRGRLREATA